MIKIKIEENDANQTIFKFIRKTFGTTSLSVIEKWFRKGNIKINKIKINNKKTLLIVGDLLEIYDSSTQIKKRENFKYVINPKLDIIYEDKNILIINKLANLEVHSLYNVSLDDLVKSYLVNIKEYNPDLEKSFLISHVHRLDKLTSGLIIYAKNKISLNILNESFKNHNKIKKSYLAFVDSFNWNSESEFICSGWIKYDSDKQKSIFSLSKLKNYKECSAKFSLIENYKDKNLINVELITGRKHQIRATLSFLKTPILNDFRYEGIKINNKKMIYLRAYKIEFNDLSKPLDYLNNKCFELGKCSFEEW